MGIRLEKDSEKSVTWTQILVGLLIGVVLSISLFSYEASDPSFHTFSKKWSQPQNWMGYMGSWSSDFLLQCLGYSAWLLPLLLMINSLRGLNSKLKKENERFFHSTFYASLLIILSCSCLAFQIYYQAKGQEPISYPYQGLLGLALSALCLPLFGKIGSQLLLLTLFIVFFRLWWKELPEYLGKLSAKPLSKFKAHTQKLLHSIQIKFYKALEKFEGPLTKMHEFIQKIKRSIQTFSSKLTNLFKKKNENNSEEESHSLEVVETKALHQEEITIAQPDTQVYAEKSIPLTRSKKPLTPAKNPEKWDLPPLSLLKNPTKKFQTQNKSELLAVSQKLLNALKSFDVLGNIVEISPGPIITMFEFQPAPGIRIQKILAVATDLAMALGVPSVRIVAPVPGKSVAGIEVPNANRLDIVLKDVIECTELRARSLKLPLYLGKDAEGKPICEDLSRMPHLLIGGATSMGKSVLVNSILTGLLTRFSPKELKLIIVDPKLVEFKIYEDIPHLLLPIVNDPKDASQALKWAVAETKRRYIEMQRLSAKNLESYNTKLDEWILQNPEEAEEKKYEKFSYIAIIVDELAELMLTAKKDVEQSIVRLTQLARAAGIHLIMATQRPSADVVTGLIKSNCPTRASLRVASASDSRIILDCSGAEVLLGQGDMFFTNSGPMGLTRIQGSFVSDEEVQRVCDFWREQGAPQYRDEILKEDTEEETTHSTSPDRDPLFEEVKAFAKDRGSLSTSLIQRRFQIGYTRAARIMEQFEDAGIVGEQVSAGKPREVII